MGKASSRKKKRREEDAADHMPPGCSRCSRCGRPWLTARMTPHKGDVLCQICEEEWQMDLLTAQYKAAEALYLMQLEQEKFSKMN